MRRTAPWGGAAAAGALLLTALVLETAFFFRFPIWGVRPDLVHVVVAATGLLAGPGAGAVTGVVGGIWADLLTGRLIGLSAITKAVAGWTAGAIGIALNRERGWVPMGAILCTSILEHVLYTLGAAAFGVHIPFLLGLYAVGLPVAAYNAICMILAYPVLVRLQLRAASGVAVRGGGR